MYTNGNPLNYVDPSELAGAGVLTGIGGHACKIVTGFQGIPIGDGLLSTSSSLKNSTRPIPKHSSRKK
jgi:hypothetical protein